MFTLTDVYFNCDAGAGVIITALKLNEPPAEFDLRFRNE